MGLRQADADRSAWAHSSGRRAPTRLVMHAHRGKWPARGGAPEGLFCRALVSGQLPPPWLPRLRRGPPRDAALAQQSRPRLPGGRRAETITVHEQNLATASGSWALPPGHPAIARRPRRRPPGGGPRRGDRALTSLVVTPRAIARDCLLPPVARFRPPIPVRICRAGLLAGDAVGCLIQRYPGSLMSVVSNPLARSARKWRLVQGRRRRAPCRPDRARRARPAACPASGYLSSSGPS
jgi:hypothetical protein